MASTHYAPTTCCRGNPGRYDAIAATPGPAGMNDQREPFDVIVVGGGGSGLAASYRVAGLGGRVLVLEKQPQLGGTTGIAVGSFTSSGTSLQRQAGIADDPAAHAADAARFAAPEIEARNNAPLRHWFLT